MNELLPFGPGAWVFIGLYVGSLLVFGWLGYRARRADTLHDFYVAGSGFGLVVILLSLYATQYSGNSFFGFTGKTYRVGFFWTLSVQFMLAIVAFYLVFAPRLHRLARERRYVTPVDYLDDRYASRALNLVAAIVMMLALSNFLLAQLMAMGRALQGLAGPHGDAAYVYGVVVLALVMVIYGTLGGLRAVAWTDVMQGGVLMIGFVLLMWLLVDQFGPLSAATTRIMQSADPDMAARVRPPDAAGVREWLSYLVMVGIGGALYPQAIQRIYAARSVTALRRSFAIMAFLPFVTALIALFAGIYGIAYVGGLEGAESDQMLTRLFRQVQETSAAGYWLVVILFAAIISAIMSTADSALLSISSMLTKDVYGRFIRPAAPEAALTRLGKICSWLLIGLLVWLAIMLKERASLIDLLDIKFDVLVQLGPAMMLGIRWRGLAAGPVLAGLILGLGVAVALNRAPPELAPGGRLWDFHAGFWGLLLNLAVAVGGSRGRAGRTAKNL